MDPPVYKGRFIEQPPVHSVQCLIVSSVYNVHCRGQPPVDYSRGCGPRGGLYMYIRTYMRICNCLQFYLRCMRTSYCAYFAVLSSRLLAVLQCLCVCCVLCTVCCVLCAVCCVLCTVCCVQSAVYSLLCAVCCVQSAVCCVQSAVYSLLSAVYSLLCAVCCVVHAVWCVLCAVCCVVRAVWCLYFVYFVFQTRTILPTRVTRTKSSK